MTPHTEPRSLRWTFVVTTQDRPTGGNLAAFEVANALARTSGDLVHIAHVPILGRRVHSLGDVPWFDFDPAVAHRFQPDLDPATLPPCDVLVYSTTLLAAALSPDAGAAGAALIDALHAPRARGWLPVLFLQSHGVFTPASERLALALPGPKVCVGSWLTDLIVRLGVPAADVVHIPNGVDPDRFHITEPISTRRPAVAMHFDPHPVKGGVAGIEALRRLHEERGVPGTLFGTRPTEQVLPVGVEFVRSPSQRAIAEQIYNRSTLFLQPSRQEGFGMCAVEAMASGCALVTTANGGSDDYAIDGETAVVCDGDPGAMAEALSRLTRDERLRVEIATNGSRFVQRFRWSTTAARLREVVDGRLPSSGA